jgi:hypothetical protein
VLGQDLRLRLEGGRERQGRRGGRGTERQGYDLVRVSSDYDTVNVGLLVNVISTLGFSIRSV